MTIRNAALRLCLALMTIPFAPAANGQPAIPVGLDAYRQWDRWPLQRPGVRAYMRSTYDRAGGNERADAAHFLYQLAEDRNVTLHVEGPGILYFARYNHWHGSPWNYEVDGKDHLVRETSTATPDKPVPGSVFEPANALPNPLTWTWPVTHGADLMWVPVAFEQSFRMMYGRTFYGTGYYIYHQFDPGAPISQPLRAWDGQTPPDKDVLDLLAKSGTDLIPEAKSPEGRQMKLQSHNGILALPADGSTTVVATLEDGPAMVRALQFSVKQSDAIAFGRARLRITWDGLPHASVDAPVALFHGAGTLYNRDDREYLVKAFPANIRYGSGRVHLSCFFPMPFARKARIELINSGPDPIGDVRWSARTGPLPEPMESLGYFHATYRDHPNPVPGEDMVWLDTRETEGGGDWSGSFIGTSFIFTHDGKLGTLEGDPRFFFDDSLTPQAYGTGTEEWGGGGDYWGGLNMTLPLAGHPCGAPKPEDARDPEDLIHSAYRFLLADLMPFGKNAVIRFEHGGRNESKEHYETVAFWYGANRPLLVPSDRLQIGDTASEEAHNYVSQEASAPYEIESRYEWGPDTLDGREIYPAHQDRGRKTTGTTEFTLAINPANTGVLLRRKLDYQFPNQRAIVSVAPVRDGKAGAFVRAGVWFLAGSNTCLFSNVKSELAPAEQVVQTSNRRFRDDEFLLPRALTSGEKKIRVRVQFAPSNIPLLPGAEPAEQAWSEIRYDAYCFMPNPAIAHTENTKTRRKTVFEFTPLTGSAAPAPAPAEVHAGPYQRIYLPPAREGQPWYINDHCFVQADDGVWHLFGITQAEPGKPQQETFFAHATSRDLLAPQWKTEPDVMHADPSLGETLVWAPHIIKHDGLYYMFYCGGGSAEVYSLRVATSPDLYQWTRHPIGPILQDGYHARDPMVLRVCDKWVLYYTATSKPSGGNHIVVAVTSGDLIHWGNRRVVFTHPLTGTYGGPTESPFVVFRDGRYYLFICENPPYNSTAVYVSKDPFSWSADSLCGRIPSHAAEVLIDSDKRWRVSRAGWGQGGVHLAELYWTSVK